MKDETSQGFKSWPAQVNSNRIHQTIVTLTLFDLNWRRLFLENDVHPFEVSYEAVVENPGEVVVELGRYLAGESFVLKSTETKLLVQRDSKSEEIKQRYIKSPILPF